MDITLVQSEIEEAIERYVLSILAVKPGMALTIEMAATRGSTGFTANIKIVPAASAGGIVTPTPASIPVLVTPPVTASEVSGTNPAPEMTPTATPETAPTATIVEAAGIESTASDAVEATSGMAVAATPMARTSPFSMPAGTGRVVDVDAGTFGDENYTGEEPRPVEAAAASATRTSLFKGLKKPVN